MRNCFIIFRLVFLLINFCFVVFFGIKVENNKKLVFGSWQLAKLGLDSIGSGFHNHCITSRAQLIKGLADVINQNLHITVSVPAKFRSNPCQCFLFYDIVGHFWHVTLCLLCIFPSITYQQKVLVTWPTVSTLSKVSSGEACTYSMNINFCNHGWSHAMQHPLDSWLLL